MDFAIVLNRGLRVLFRRAARVIVKNPPAPGNIPCVVISAYLCSCWSARHCLPPNPPRRRIRADRGPSASRFAWTRTHVSDPHWVKRRIPSTHSSSPVSTKPGLTPSAPQPAESCCCCRVTYDLTGLPPTLKELDDFLADDRPDAYARVVDRLLASPHFGERWAQHWLDVVRYAESNGYESDGERPHAWRYRDYVVKAFNEDKPYDRFLTEQLAGDMLAGEAARKGVAGADLPEATELIAAGFNRCGQVHQTVGNLDAEMLRQELLTEMTNGVGAAFLGLTVACCRCHDHKFDPLPQSDYYRLQAFFSITRPSRRKSIFPRRRSARRLNAAIRR